MLYTDLSGMTIEKTFVGVRDKFNCFEKGINSMDAKDIQKRAKQLLKNMQLQRFWVFLSDSNNIMV